MSAAELIIGPALEVVRNWTRDPVQSVITSPPYWRKRDYLAADDPAKADEWGQEPSPAILQPLAHSPGNRYTRQITPSDIARRDQGAQTANVITAAYDPTESDGVPPLDWWVVNTSGYDGAHFATFPPELIVRPVIASCPPGGTILDPFVGSGTTLAVATGHGRNAIGIDLDARNEHLIRERVGLFLTVEGAA